MASDPWDALSASHSAPKRLRALPPLLLPRNSTGVGNFLLLWNADIIRAAKAYAFDVGADDAAAADAAQLVRIRLWRKAKHLSVQPTEYIRATIANAVENAFRTEKGGLNPTRSRLRPLIGDEYPDVEIDRDLIIDVKDWLSTLSEPMRQVYELLFVEGRTERNAAAIIGVSQPRVHQLRERLLALGRLRFSDKAA
jgi:RNA polymerase sigma factor (sigma-70 family)